MPLDLQGAATEYIGWLQLEANRSPNTVRAYESEINKLITFLAENRHTLALADLRHEDLRAYQRRLAGKLKSPASRAWALVAIRSWLRWLAREGLNDRDLSNGITLPKLEQRLGFIRCAALRMLPRAGRRIVLAPRGGARAEFRVSIFEFRPQRM
jgi:integrase/recombinase XerC